MPGQPFDLFISHANEDKDEVVVPLVELLRKRGLKVWLDQDSLGLGDSLRRGIEQGIVGSRFAVVVCSAGYFGKVWAQREMDALLAREDSGCRVLLPVRHRLTVEEFKAQAPLLADRLSVSTDDGLPAVVDEIERAVRGGAATLERRSRPARRSTRRVRWWAASAVVIVIASVGVPSVWSLWPEPLEVQVRVRLSPDLEALLSSESPPPWFDLWPRSSKTIPQARLVFLPPDSMDVWFLTPPGTNLTGAEFACHSKVAITPKTSLVEIEGAFAAVNLYLADADAKPRIGEADVAGLIATRSFQALDDADKIRELSRHAASATDPRRKREYLDAIPSLDLLRKTMPVASGSWSADSLACTTMWAALLSFQEFGPGAVFKGTGGRTVSSLRFWNDGAELRLQQIHARELATRLDAYLVRAGATRSDRKASIDDLATALANGDLTMTRLAETVAKSYAFV